MNNQQVDHCSTSCLGPATRTRIVRCAHALSKSLHVLVAPTAARILLLKVKWVTAKGTRSRWRVRGAKGQAGVVLAGYVPLVRSLL